jgi:hypothetical protein
MMSQRAGLICGRVHDGTASCKPVDNITSSRHLMANNKAEIYWNESMRNLAQGKTRG